MQPYFFPYIGYFQLIHAVVEFILYDNIEFSKKGWINRNRILVNGKAAYITLPLKKASDFLNIRERYLTDSIEDRNKIIRRIKESYRKAHYFEDTFGLIHQILNYDNNNLFDFIYHSIQIVCKYLGINTPVYVSFSIDIDHSLKSEQKVIAIVKKNGGDTYVNLIGGLSLYSQQVFKENGINLKFLQSKPYKYKQYKHEFVPWLSIIDLMMFNPKDEIMDMLNLYTLK